MSDFIFWGSKITADGDCSHEILRRLLLGRKVMTNLDSIFKSRDITLPPKVPLVKAMVFPVIMYGCESWTVKKAGGRRIDAFELWCWRRLLRVPWTARRSNQSILREISPGISLDLELRSVQLGTHSVDPRSLPFPILSRQSSPCPLPHFGQCVGDTAVTAELEFTRSHVLGVAGGGPWRSGVERDAQARL